LNGFSGGQVLERCGLDVDAHFIAVVDQGMHATCFQQRQADLQAIAIERAGELLGNDRADLRGRKGLRSQCASRGATEVTTRNQNVARPNLLRELRINGF
jgi:hypothetical protein